MDVTLFTEQIENALSCGPSLHTVSGEISPVSQRRRREEDKRSSAESSRFLTNVTLGE